MGTRSERLRAAQETMAREPGRGMTRAEAEGAARPARPGVVTMLLAAGAVLSLLGLAAGGGLEALGGAIFLALLAWLNEWLRARARARRGE